MRKALGAGAVALCALMLLAINHARAISAVAAVAAVAGALLVLLASVAAALSGAPVRERGACVGLGMLIGLALPGGATPLAIFGAV
jgi:hypothetical protein